MDIENKLHKKKKSRKAFFRNIVLLLFIISFLSLGILYFFNMIPLLYFFGILLFLFSFDFFMGYLLLGKGWKKRFFGTILTVLMIILLLILDIFSLKTMDFLGKINTDGNYNTENYSVIVLKSSSYDKLKELKNKELGIVNLGEDKGLIEAKKVLDKKIEVSYKMEEDLTVLYNRLQKGEIAGLLIEEAEKGILEEEHPEFLEQAKILYRFSIDIPLEDNLAKNVDITNSPFTIFISGIDSYGKITSVSRSDVNMVISINPSTHKVLVTSIPRDYYIKLHGISTPYKDKLTHAGTHGIDMSVKTVEDLLAIDINYYAKVNFTSLVNLVDELGGIDVELDKPFRAYYNEDGKITNYSFKKGTNHLNGKQALAFSRERKSLPLGDVTRVKHQQMVIEGIFNKILSKSIITKYTDILNALEGKFVTNFGTQNISKLVKKQIKDNPSWTLSTYTLTGVDAHEYTYSYKSTKSYVMKPNEESIEESKRLIQSVLEKEE